MGQILFMAQRIWKTDVCYFAFEMFLQKLIFVFLLFRQTHRNFLLFLMILLSPTRLRFTALILVLFDVIFRFSWFKFHVVFLFLLNQLVFNQLIAALTPWISLILLNIHDNEMKAAASWVFIVKEIFSIFICLSFSYSFC